MNQKTPNFYPRETATRTMKELSGFWKIVFDAEERGEQYYSSQSSIPDRARFVGVPGSFNDQFTEASIRDYVGKVYYYTEVMMPDAGAHAFLRFGSVNYHASVYINGEKIGEHSGGHMSFTLPVPSACSGQKVLLCVVVDNRLSKETIPPGKRIDYTIEKEGVDFKKQDYHFDFFHYCGLNRKVWLLTTPKTFVVDSTIVTTDIGDGKKATLSYDLSVTGEFDEIKIILKDNGTTVAEVENAQTVGAVTVENPTLWEVGVGGLHDFIIQVRKGGELVDEAVERIGIRTVEIKGLEFLVNNKPVYFKGFGRHEDTAIFGRYVPEPVLIRDYALMKWIGANSFRTSHYPYAEESMILADEMGFMVIDETSAVGLNEWNVAGARWFDADLANENTLKEHQHQLQELMYRDKNRACVVMWSVSNEAATGDQKAPAYFEPLIQYAKKTDNRPVTMITFMPPAEERCAHLFDMICWNRYEGWYMHPGDLQVANKLLGDELDAFYEKYKKPVMMTEFGVDTIEGIHALPSRMFSEEFQVEFIEEYIRIMRERDYIIGEHVWNFADFQTSQTPARVNGNRKGVFTRERQPKMVAHLLRKIWK